LEKTEIVYKPYVTNETTVIVAAHVYQGLLLSLLLNDHFRIYAQKDKTEVYLIVCLQSSADTYGICMY